LLAGNCPAFAIAMQPPPIDGNATYQELSAKQYVRPFDSADWLRAAADYWCHGDFAPGIRHHQRSRLVSGFGLFDELDLGASQRRVPHGFTPRFDLEKNLALTLRPRNQREK
jgi:hypothetical protein